MSEKHDIEQAKSALGASPSIQALDIYISELSHIASMITAEIEIAIGTSMDDSESPAA